MIICRHYNNKHKTKRNPWSFYLLFFKSITRSTLTIDHTSDQGRPWGGAAGAWGGYAT